MAVREKFLIVWILGTMAAAFLASHALGCLVAGFENAFAFAFGSAAVFAKLVAAFVGCWQS